MIRMNAGSICPMHGRDRASKTDGATGEGPGPWSRRVGTSREGSVAAGISWYRGSGSNRPIVVTRGARNKVDGVTPPRFAAKLAHTMSVATNLSPAEAIKRLVSQIEPVEAETVSEWSAPAIAGRALAAPLMLNRDSPACDVSAMDGFAVRLAEFVASPLPIAGECRIGAPPEELPAGATLRIYTGSPTPAGCDTVVPLERVHESDGRAEFARRDDVAVGANIRHQGENARAGDAVLSPGVELTPAALTALATIGGNSVRLFRRLSVAIITTGDELEDAYTEQLPPWRLRDSNGPTLEALLSIAPWIGAVKRTHAADTLTELTGAVSKALESADAVVLTGGVSKGAYDYVPKAVEAAGATPVFHRLAARPGRPTFAAVAGGRPIVGLPGNPVAVLTAGTRIVGPALRRRAGFGSLASPTLVRLNAWSGKTLPLTWWRPVTVGDDGEARLVELRGSGDTCGGAATDGFIECPPESHTAGDYPFFAWRV